jgi:hypothetical protein
MISLRLFVISLGLLPLCYGATIAAVSPYGTHAGRALTTPGSSVFSFGWSQTEAYTNVTIRVDIEDFDLVDGGGTVTGYLTDQVGVGTTQATNEVEPSVTVPYAGGQTGLLTIFAGLNLGPGNYFVTVTGEGFSFMGETGTPTATLGTGVALLGTGFDCCSPSSYIPSQVTPWTGSSWTFEVTGDPVAVPEPSSLLLMGAGVLVLLRRSLRG